MDRRSVKETPPGSKENPLQLKDPEIVVESKKWAVPISPELQNTSKVLAVIEPLSPWLDLSQKLGVQANSLISAAVVLKKNDKPKEKVDAIMERLRPVLALKEDIDLYISTHCENILDKLEAGEYNYNYANSAKETATD